MRLTRLVVRMLLAGMTVLGAGVVSGQAYPTKPIRIITAEPGGGYDFTARVVAQALSGSLGQQVIVDNRGGGVILAELVAKAPPDGYTLLVSGNNLWVTPFLQTVPYDPVRDFSPISLMNSSPNLLVVHPSLPVKSVKDLIALAKTRPGELDYSTGNLGSASHLAADLFKNMAGVNMMRIPYKAAGSAINALIGGQVQLMFATAGSVAPHVKSGRLAALAVTSAGPSKLFPGLPTVAASVPGYKYMGMVGMFAPAKTPAAIIDRLNQETARVLNRADVKERFFNVGVEVVGGSPEHFAATIRSDMAGMGKVIKDAGLRAD